MLFFVWNTAVDGLLADPSALDQLYALRERCLTTPIDVSEHSHDGAIAHLKASSDVTRTDAGAFGHMFNDCMRLMSFDPDAVASYCQTMPQCPVARVVVFGGVLQFMCTTREVNANDEIFQSYGPSYWVTQDGFTRDDVCDAKTPPPSPSLVGETAKSAKKRSKLERKKREKALAAKK